MARIDWTKEAIENVRDIVRFIHDDSPFFAHQVQARIFSAVNRLVVNPVIGWVVDEFGRQDLREILAYSYRIVYRVRDDVCRIIAVIHASRDLKRWINPNEFNGQS